MTIPTFLRELKKLKGLKWNVSESESIRCQRGDCPIVALARAKNLDVSDMGGNAWADDIGVKIALTRSAAWRIMRAADGLHTSSQTVRLRKQLLRALKLREVK